MFERHARTSRPDADADLHRDHPRSPSSRRHTPKRRLQRVSPPVSAVKPEQGECRKRHHGRDDGERGQRFHYPTIAGWRSSRRTGEARITSAWTKEPGRGHDETGLGAGHGAQERAERGADRSRAVGVMLMADARPSRSRGVTV